MEFVKRLLSFNFILDTLLHPLFLFAVLLFKVTSRSHTFLTQKYKNFTVSQETSEGRFSGNEASCPFVYHRGSPGEGQSAGVKEVGQRSLQELAVSGSFCFEVCADFGQVSHHFYQIFFLS